ncbi:atherin-like [Cervus elaphus]|uniref:atherin-like n=1 Tax=Cervus elaphus TaxID=9860 RepID=UPI001CC2B647|nr:atherin-like [Cervus elaphus]
MNVFLLLFWTASREAGPVGGEAAWGPGVALELPSLPGAVPSPRQAPSHTPTPPTPPGPEARRVGVWICWDAARGSCAPSPEAVQSGCVQGPWRVSAQVSERALDLCAPPAVLGRRLLPGGPGFAPVCWPEGGEVCVAPTGRIDAWACPLPLRAQPGQWRDNRKWPASDLPGAGSAQRDQRASLGGNARTWALRDVYKQIRDSATRQPKVRDSPTVPP